MKKRETKLTPEEAADRGHKMERLKRNLDPATFSLAKKLGKAINDFDMIRDGDRVLVAVSGGKDSVTLLHLLAMRLIWLPIKYELVAVHVQSDMRCAGCAHPDTLKKFFSETGVEGHFEDFPIMKYLSNHNLKMSCYYCARGRRKILFDSCKKYNCNVLAMGHHIDDIAHTLMMNLFLHGKVEGMAPCMDLFKGTVRLVRPLAYIHEAETAEYVKRIGFPSHLCNCPQAKKNVRRTMKVALDAMKTACRCPEVNAFRALYGKIDGEAGIK